MSKVAPIEVSPRKYFNRSNFGIPKVARNEDVFKGFAVFSLLGVPQVAQNEDVFEGFGVFGAIWGFQMWSSADAHCIENI